MYDTNARVGEVPGGESHATAGLVASGPRVAKLTTGVTGMLTLVLALLSLAWHGLPMLRMRVPGSLVMHVSAACVVSLLALALLLLRVGEGSARYRLGARCSALLAGLFMVFVMLVSRLDGQWLTGRWLVAGEAQNGIGHLWAVPSSGGLALALALVLGGGAGTVRGRISALLTVMAGVIGVLILLGYLLDAGALYNAHRETRVAPTGAVALVLLALGALASAPHRAPISVILADDAGGASLRRMLPTVALVVLVLVVARHSVENAGLLHPSTSAGVFATLGVSLLGGLLLIDAAWLSRVHRRQRSAESRLARLAEDLELQVAARTRELAQSNASLQAEIRERRRAEALFRGVFEAVPDAVLVVSDDGCIELANRRVDALLGYTREQLVGAPVGRLVPEEILEAHRARWRSFLANPTPFRLFGEAEGLPARRADGSPVMVEVALGALLSDDRQRVIVSMRDVEERLAAQRRAREADQRFRLLVDNLPVGIFVADDHPLGRLLEANPAMQRILEAESMEELLESPVASFNVSAEACSALLEQARRLGGLTGAACTGMTLRGRQFEAALSVAPRQTAQGLVWDGVLEDVTDRKLAERRIMELNKALTTRAGELESTNRELEAFSYSVSHDLRAPLRAIDGFSRILEQECMAHLDEANRDRLARVRRNAQHMGQLIDDLLGLARVTRAQVHWGTVDLTALAREVLLGLAEAQPQRQVQVDVAPDLRVHGDVRLLRVAMQNLLDNAWKFTARTTDARIVVDAEVHDTEQVFVVRDNGAGFDMAHAEKLFGAFQRLHRMDEFPGTGIGLATVQRIIHKHGGRIWAEAAPEHGATFYFTLSQEAGDAGTDHPAG